MTKAAKKFTSTVAGASILLTMVGLLSRGLGLVRESLFANYFGLSAEYDLYLVSVVLPMTINTITIFFAQNFFIPIYHQKESEAENDKPEFLTYSFLLFVVSGILISIILLLSGSWFLNFYISSGIDNQSFQQSVTIFRIYVMTIPLNAGFSILAAYFQAEYDFIYPSLAVLILNTTVITLTIIFNKVLDILVIPVSYFIGIFLELVFLIVKSGFRIRIKMGSVGSRMLKYLNLVKSSFLFIIIIEGIGQIYLISDRYFFDQVASGGIAALNYGMILFNLPVSIFSVAFATAMFPGLSENFSIQNSKELENKSKQYFSICSFLFVPIAFCFIFWGLDFIKLFFERGRFDASDSIMTFKVLRVYSLGLIFYSGYALINKLFYASQLIKYLLGLSLIGLLLKIILNFILVVPFAQNGLALSTAVTYTFFFVSGAWLIFRLLKLRVVSVFYKELLFGGVNVTLSAVITYIIFLDITKFKWMSIVQILTFSVLYLFNSSIIDHKAIVILKNVRKKII